MARVHAKVDSTNFGTIVPGPPIHTFLWTLEYSIEFGNVMAVLSLQSHCEKTSLEPRRQNVIINVENQHKKETSELSESSSL
jgi:hypothetical protein